MPAVAPYGRRRVCIAYLGVDLATHTLGVTRDRGRVGSIGPVLGWGCVVDKATFGRPSRGERGLPLPDMGCHPVFVPKGHTEPRTTDAPRGVPSAAVVAARH